MSWDQDENSSEGVWPAEPGVESSSGTSIVEGNDVELPAESTFETPLDGPEAAGSPPPVPPEPPLDPNDPAAMLRYQEEMQRYNSLMSTLSNVQQMQHETQKNISRNLRG